MLDIFGSVNNAGLGYFGTFEETPDVDVKYMLMSRLGPSRHDSRRSTNYVQTKIWNHRQLFFNQRFILLSNSLLLSRNQVRRGRH